MLNNMNEKIEGTDREKYNQVITKRVFSEITNISRRFRTSRILWVSRQQRFTCPAMFIHPSNFIRHVQHCYNSQDTFYKKFFVPFVDYEAELKWSLRNVKVSEIYRCEQECYNWWIHHQRFPLFETQFKIQLEQTCSPPKALVFELPNP